MPGPSQRIGRYIVALRLPSGGLVAGSEQQIEFRITDAGRNDPVLGPPGVIRATIEASVSMPAMPQMPRAEEVAHPEGVPGDYGLHPTFAHGGDYRLLLRIKPPADEPFIAEFPLTVLDEITNRRAQPKTWRVEIKTEPGRVKAGEKARLRLAVKADREIREDAGVPTGRRRLEPVRDFDLLHERLMHLIIVRRDLGFFAHEHPVQQSDGSFTLDGFVFPASGEYRLFIDAAPRGAGAQVASATVKVEGTPAPPSHRIEGRESVIDGLRVIIDDKAALAARRTQSFRVAIKDAATGNPVTDLEPYLGAFGHLIMIGLDAETFVHAHPDEREPRNAPAGEIVFLVRPPKAGRYRLWVEFKRGGQVRSVCFDVDVE